MLPRRFLIGILSLALGLAVRAAVPVPPEHAAQMAKGLELFKSDVAQLLSDHCVKCHGGEKGTKGDLDLATREGLLKGGEEGPAIVPGNARASFLMKLIRHEEEPQMPKKGEKLSDGAIAKIAQWIDLGAPYAKPLVEGKRIAQGRPNVTDEDRQFWAFRPLLQPAIPAVKNEAWGRTPIDRFILAKLEEKRLVPNSPVDRRQLIRRAFFALIGLPPTAEQVERFVHDPAPDAYEKLLDQLLANPHYGERWGRHWLDLARFAESHGYEQDYDRPHAFHYRDFVIQALNDDLPYDEFVRWQIAGDELAPDNPLAWKATGFLAAGTHATQITANQAEKERYDELDDMAATIGSAMLGLSVGCARCHDHKFDPIPTADYYRLISTFTKTVRSDHDMEIDAAQTRVKRTAWEQTRTTLQTALANFAASDLLAWFPPAGPASEKARRAAKVEALADLENAWPLGPVAAAARWLASANRAHAAREPRPQFIKALVSSEGLPAVRLHTQGPDFYDQTFLLKRGDLAQKQGEAPQGFLQVLMRAPEQERRWLATPPSGARTPWRRASLAAWITDPELGAGHLLARVIVNRLWQHHLGRGIVATPSDFGAQGEKPTHPELLDWLAGELIRGGWRLKPLHRQIMLSAVYLQSCETDPTRATLDPQNTLRWHRPRQRLEGEIIRDAILAVSGTLDKTMFGAGSLDAAMKRRSTYFQLKRSALPPMMATFDAPDTLQSMGERASTTVAPQALLLMNNALVRESARSWAKRLAGTAPATVIQRAYLSALARPPNENELVDATEFLAAQHSSYVRMSKPAAEELALIDFCQVLMSLNEFAYVE